MIRTATIVAPANRTGKRDLILYVCTAVAVVVPLLLRQSPLAVVLSLALGLIGMAPAGVIMALTGEAMAPQRRASVWACSSVSISC